jgi:hypothetical protein
MVHCLYVDCTVHINWSSLNDYEFKIYVICFELSGFQKLFLLSSPGE